MSHDLHQTFAEVFPNPRDLKKQILEILPHIRSRDNFERPKLTFLGTTSPSLKAQACTSDLEVPKERCDPANQSSIEKMQEGGISDSERLPSSLTPHDVRDQPLTESRRSTTYSDGIGDFGEWSSPSHHNDTAQSLSETMEEGRLSSRVSDDDGPSDPSELDNLGRQLRTFELDDADDPNLRLSLVRSDVPMGGIGKRYLAVSYCWPSKEDNTDHLGPLNLPLIIDEADGTSRPSRALPHIIRRAIRHAAALDMKYIWIDQESIDQDDSEAKQAAIQCMDSVYRTAEDILCLLSVHIDKQEQIDALEGLHYFNRGGARSRFNMMSRHIGGLTGTPELADVLTDIFHLVAGDRWFTRAWIMHERLCSGDFSSSGIWATCSAELQSCLPGEVCLIANDQLEDAREIAFRLERGEVRKEDGSPSEPDASSTSPSAEDANKEHPEPKLVPPEFLRAAERLRGATASLQASYQLINPAARRRRIADAVRSYYSPLQGIHLLGPLHCLYPSDKLAMLPNACHWGKSLDTRIVDSNGWSFGLCLWMLAIANGDASFFCRESFCRTNATAGTAAWAPQAQTNLQSMYCDGLLDFVSMQLRPDGLYAKGWLWKSYGFVDLKELIPLIEHIDRSVPKVETSGWINYEFKTHHREDRETKLKKFFWALLLKLSSLRENECVDLIWKAAKRRHAGGFYGRDLSIIPIENFDKIVDPNTGQYIACYDSLGITRAQEEDELYSKLGPIPSAVVSYLRQGCEHCRKAQGIDQELDDRVSAEDDDTAPMEEPSAVLLGFEEQLRGIEWIRTAILTHGGLSLGRIIAGDQLSDPQYLPTPAAPDLALLDLPAESNSANVFTLHREVRKYKQGDGKAMMPLHPFDVWLKDSPRHTDAPFCWTATADPNGDLEVHSPCNALFHIDGIARMGYTFGWPKAYDRDSWT